MRRIVAISVLVVAAIGLTYAQTRPEKPSAAASRYQLVAVTATYEGKDGRQADGPEVFLVDTETGRVWKYEFPRAEKKLDDGSLRRGFPAYFIEIAVTR